VRGPGGPTADVIPAYLSNGEYVMPAHAVAHYGAGFMDLVRARKFAAGGLAVRAVTPSDRTIKNDVIAAVQALADKNAAALLAPTFGPGGGAGAARWGQMILAVLAMLGQSPSWLGTVERRMNQESGGNASIVNRWDSNWLAGHPSVGLMQVIAGTFAAYAGRYRNTGPFEYGVSVDPTANTYAGLNYALHRYGSLAALNRPGGYGNGGTTTEDILGMGASGRAYKFHAGEEVTPTATVERQIALLEQILRKLGQLLESTDSAPAGFARVLNGTAGLAGHGAR
jgi:hypothetical protein